MFGKFKRDSDMPPIRGGDPTQRRVTVADFGFGSMAQPSGEQTLANYDRLGVTLVATPLVATMSGPDAAALAADVCEHIYQSHHDPSSPSGVRHVVLDLQNVQYMDSMCVGVLVELLTTLKEAGGRIALVNASSNVEYLFTLTRLDRVFPICRDTMKAIQVVEREG